MKKLRRHNKKETFHYFDQVVDINRAKKLLKKRKRPIKLVDVNNLYHKIDWSLLDLNPKHASKTNLRKPLIFAVSRGSRHQAYSLLVDGHHRLYKAYREGIERLPAFFLTRYETNACVLAAQNNNI